MAEDAKPKSVRESSEAADRPDSLLSKKPGSASSSTAIGQATVVAPSVVQARNGATTHLLTRNVAPPAHLPGGRVRIVTNSELIDSNTLLPKQTVPLRSPQTAASAPSSR